MRNCIWFHILIFLIHDFGGCGGILSACHFSCMTNLLVERQTLVIDYHEKQRLTWCFSKSYVRAPRTASRAWAYAIKCSSPIQGISYCSPLLQAFITRKPGPTFMELFTPNAYAEPSTLLLAEVPVYFFGLNRKLARTRSTSSSAINGRPLDFCSHRHPVSVKFWVVPSICTGFVNTCRTVFL